MALASAYTLDTTYAIQLEGTDGEWNWVDQAEFTDEADVHERGRTMYGGEVPYRVVTITRQAGLKMGGAR